MDTPILSNLKYAAGSRKRVKRVGRGQGSGHGGTATRGHKGEGARSGTKFRPWFEGGQMPLVRRVPKFGFHNPFKREYQIVNIGTLAKLVSTGKIKGDQINPENLRESGVVKKSSLPIKVLGNGDLKVKLDISVHAFSNSAIKKIEAVGGKAIKISTTK